jgi:hypothetical protein
MSDVAFTTALLDELERALLKPVALAMSPQFVANAQQAIPQLLSEIRRLQAAIRRHRDYRGDDRCFLDDRELYAVLPEGYTPPAKDSAVTLAQCERYIACRQDPATEYVSPQRRIEELEAQVKLLNEALTQTDPDSARNDYLERKIEALAAENVALRKQISDRAVPIISESPFCVCGHSLEAHEGHTFQSGSEPPTHCSQGCECKRYRRQY